MVNQPLTISIHAVMCGGGGMHTPRRRLSLAVFPVNCVNCLTLERPKMCEPLFAKLNTRQRGCKCAHGWVSPWWSRLA
jgi:hypothetical protein